MATVNGYIPQVTPLMFESEKGRRMASGCLEYGGWDHKNKSLTPNRVAELLTMRHNPALHWELDSMAAAAEAGRLDAEQYVEQLFASKEDARVPPCPTRSGR